MDTMPGRLEKYLANWLLKQTQARVVWVELKTRIVKRIGIGLKRQGDIGPTPNNGNPFRSSKLVCSYCGKTNHSVEDWDKRLREEGAEVKRCQMSCKVPSGAPGQKNKD